VSCAETAELIEMQFGMLSRVDPGKCPRGKGHFGGVWPIEKHGKD